MDEAAGHTDRPPSSGTRSSAYLYALLGQPIPDAPVNLVAHLAELLQPGFF